MIDHNNLQTADREIFNLINQEAQRQEDHIELIASENYVSRAVLEAQGSILTNKYAEGYPNKRYYGGCCYVDQIELRAINRVKQLFNAQYANVQPHSGSQANQAVYLATLKPGDTILGMSLAHGGHLTHGASVSSSGKLFNIISYGVDNNEAIDYEELERLAIQHKPKLIIAGASSYALAIDFARFRQIADMVGAYLMADIAHYAGLIIAGIYPDPIPHADFVTSTTHKTLRGPRGGLILAKEEYAKILNSAVFPGIQGGPLEHIIAAKAVAFKEASTIEFKTYQQQVRINADILVAELIKHDFRIVSGKTQSHLLMIDLQNKHITGKEAETLLGAVGITCNKNAIPNDPKSPFITSGIRLGTPAITTRGFKEQECIIIAQMIADVINSKHDEVKLKQIAGDILSLCHKFPVYA